MRPHRFEHARAGTLPVWPRSGARKIGDVGGGAGVLDQVADAHDVAADRDRSLEPRRAGRAVLARRRRCRAQRQAARARMTMRIMAAPQRIRLEVADSIWSAAVMTLAFIS